MKKLIYSTNRIPLELLNIIWISYDNEYHMITEFSRYIFNKINLTKLIFKKIINIIN